MAGIQPGRCQDNNTMEPCVPGSYIPLEAMVQQGSLGILQPPRTTAGANQASVTPKNAQAQDGIPAQLRALAWNHQIEEPAEGRQDRAHRSFGECCEAHAQAGRDRRPTTLACEPFPQGPEGAGRPQRQEHVW
jgi:hypothetical protein